MIVNVYGIPSELVVRWILERVSSLNIWVDLGSGSGDYLRSINFKPKEGIGVDLVSSPSRLPPEFIFEKREINEWLGKNRKKMDLISMFDVVEHFPKKEALTLIGRVKNSAANVIISTPHGFMRQDGETHPEERNNPYQWHKCGFAAEEFEKLGFLVFILKKYHYCPPGNDKTFDKLVCFWSVEQPASYTSLANSIKIKNLVYLLNPLHFYRLVRDVLVRPNLLRSKKEKD
jgi:hypothetical protein